MNNSRFKKKFISIISVIGSFIFLIGILIHIYNGSMINSYSEVTSTYNLGKEEFNEMKDLVLNKKYISYQIIGNKINICNENECIEFSSKDENKRTILLFMKKYKLESINVNFYTKSVTFSFKISLFDPYSEVSYSLIYSQSAVTEEFYRRKIDGTENWYVVSFVHI